MNSLACMGAIGWHSALEKSPQFGSNCDVAHKNFVRQFIDVVGLLTMSGSDGATKYSQFRGFRKNAFRNGIV
ncbi:MAG: hypothetical protein Q4B94_00500 [Pseudomonadota bacterium]|nr:hypothetical protein [Pseudomonadota bacterium]